MHHLSGLDAAFLYMETPETPMHVGGLNIFELPLDYEGEFLDRLREHIAQRMHLAPVFQRKLVNMPFELANPIWVADDDLDMEYHIRSTVLPKPGNRAQLDKLVGRLHSSLLDRSRPLWEFYVIEVQLDSTPDRRWIICHNPQEAERDQAQRDDAVARLQAELDQIAAARARDAARAKKAGRKLSDDAHRKAECALRDHPTLGRYLRQTATGRLQIDRAAVKAEERLDGKYLLSTSDPTMTAEDVALGYKNLLEAERGFRDLKSTLELRPVFHRIEPRIRAHVLLCWLALLLIRVAERRCDSTWRQIATELGRIHAVTLDGPAGTVVQTTPPSDRATGFLRACQVDPPPRITHLQPA